MFKLRGKRVITPILLSGLLAMSGCGKKVDTIEEYGGQTVEQIENTGVENTGSEEASSETSGGVTGVDEGSLSEKLGGEKLSFKDSVEVQGQFISIDLEYNVPDIDRLPTYRVTPMTSESIKEDDIVNNLFKDTAVPINDGRVLTKAEGDNVELINYIKQIYTLNLLGDGTGGDRCDAWKEDGDFYLHTYEGKYRDKDYQLAISYSSLYQEMYVLLYPKNMPDVGSKPELKEWGFSSLDGNLNLYYHNTMKMFDIHDVMADRPNECKSTDDQLSDMVRQSLRDDFYINLPEGDAGLTFHRNIFDEYFTVNDDKINDDSKCEIVFFDEEMIDDPTFEGAIRHGYVGLLMQGPEDIIFLNKKVYLSSGNTGMVQVDDDGLIGLQFGISYNFEEELSDNAELLNFQTAMEALKKDVSEHLDLSQVDSKGLAFKEIEMLYYPIDSPENPGECTYVPAWAVVASNGQDFGNGYALRCVFVINALDGSFIDIAYPNDIGFSSSTQE